MKNLKYILAILAVCSSTLIVFAQKLSPVDSMKLVNMETTVNELAKQNKSLSKQVTELKTAKDKLETIGITASALSVLGLLYLLFLHFKGINDKAEKAINRLAPVKIKELAPDIVTSTMNAHPLIDEYNQKLKLKEKAPSILVISPDKKNKYFHDFLERKGFKNSPSTSIDQIDNIDTNTIKYIFFNNERGELTQEQMDKVTDKYTTAVDYFYYNTSNQRWEGKEEIRMSGFANSRETLENRLLEALKK